MPKLTEYPEAQSFDENDILIKDGVNGTKKIKASNAADYMGKNVIMVNEDPTPGTKVVLETTDEEYELALMSDVNSVAEEVDDVKTQLEKTIIKTDNDFCVTKKDGPFLMVDFDLLDKNGYVNGSTGDYVAGISAAGLNCCTDFIKISGNDIVFYNNIQWTFNVIQYDKDKQRIASNLYDNVLRITLTPDTNAVYVRFSFIYNKISGNTSVLDTGLAMNGLIQKTKWRDGSTGNTGNTNAIANVLILPVFSANKIKVIINDTLQTGESFRLLLTTYSIASGDPLANGDKRVTSDLAKITFNNICEFDINDGSKGFCIAIFKRQNDESYIPLRIETFDINNIYLIREYDEKSVDNETVKYRQDWILGGIYAVDGTQLNNTNRASNEVSANTKYIDGDNTVEYSLFIYDGIDYLGTWDATTKTLKNAVVWNTGNIQIYDIYDTLDNYNNINIRISSRLKTNTDITDLTGISNHISFTETVYTETIYNKSENKKYIGSVNMPYISSITAINDFIYKFRANASETPNDNVDLNYTMYRIYNDKYISINETIYQSASRVSNFGHQNSVDYNENNHYLLSSNAGGSANTNPSQIYLIKDADQLESFDVNSEYCVTIDISQDGNFGKQPNCYWGDDNLGRNDLIYILSNYESGNMSAFETNNICDYRGDSTRFIHLVQLGKGINNLGSGNYIAKGNDEFNGSYKILKSWNYPFVYADGINDGQYYNGDIYLNTVYEHALRIMKLSFYNDEVIKKYIDIPSYNANGNVVASEGEGLCIHNGLLYVGNLGVKIFDIDSIK